MLAPGYEELSKKYDPEEVLFLKIDGEEVPELTRSHRVRLYPTTLLYYAGNLADGVEGANLNRIKAKINFFLDVKQALQIKQ